jgi:hypothetical protein
MKTTFSAFLGETFALPIHNGEPLIKGETERFLVAAPEHAYNQQLWGAMLRAYITQLGWELCTGYDLSAVSRGGILGRNGNEFISFHLNPRSTRGTWVVVTIASTPEMAAKWKREVSGQRWLFDEEHQDEGITQETFHAMQMAVIEATDSEVLAAFRGGISLQTIEMVELRLAKAMLKPYQLLDTESEILYAYAAHEVQIIVDEKLRPISNEEGVKALDAYRYYRDRSFMPKSFTIEVEGKEYLSGEFIARLNAKASDFFHPSDWGRNTRWPEGDNVGRFPVFITHFSGYSNRGILSQFFSATRDSFPELYLRVLLKLVESFEAAAEK